MARLVRVWVVYLQPAIPTMYKHIKYEEESKRRVKSSAPDVPDQGFSVVCAVAPD